MFYKIPLIFSLQPEGGYTVTSPLIPELITEGDTPEEALANVKDALAAVLELYQDLGKVWPQSTKVTDTSGPVWFETVVANP